MSTLELEGLQQFTYVASRFENTLSEALKSMEVDGQDMAWFYTLGKGMQVAIKGDDRHLTDYLKGALVK